MVCVLSGGVQFCSETGLQYNAIVPSYPAGRCLLRLVTPGPATSEHNFVVT